MHVCACTIRTALHGFRLPLCAGAALLLSVLNRMHKVWYLNHPLSCEQHVLSMA